MIFAVSHGLVHAAAKIIEWNVSTARDSRQARERGDDFFYLAPRDGIDRRCDIFGKIVIKAERACRLQRLAQFVRNGFLERPNGGHAALNRLAEGQDWVWLFFVERFFAYS